MKKTAFICIILFAFNLHAASPPGGTMFVQDLDDCPSGKVCVDNTGAMSAPSVVMGTIDVTDLASLLDLYRTKPVYFHDVPHSSAGIFNSATGIASGTASGTSVESSRWGVSALLCHASNANSGFFMGTQQTTLILAGSEIFETVFRPALLTGVTARFGFQDTADHGDATDGVYFEVGTTGLISGKTANSSTRSQTDTTYQLVINTWYRARIVLNSGYTLATYSLYNPDTGALLWSDTLGTNLPTPATGVRYNVTLDSPSGAVALHLVDMMAFGSSRALSR